MRRASASLAPLVLLVVAGCGDSGTLPADAGPGTDVACVVSLAAIPDHLDFGVQSASQHPLASIAIANTGTCATRTLMTSFAGAHAEDFSAASSSCDGEVLAPGASCVVAVQLSPAAPGHREAELRVDGADAVLSVPLSADVIAGGSDLFVVPGHVDFGSFASPGARRTITVANGGSWATGILSTTLGGATPESYALVADTCSGTALGPATSCTLDVEIRCAPAASQGATVTVVAIPGGAVSVPVTGTIGGKTCFAVFTASPSGETFADQPVGTQGAATRFTFTNFGGQPSAQLSPSLAGAASGAFAITASTCTNVVVPAGGACTIDVAFAPTSAGPATAMLTFANATVALSGKGLGPATLELSPAMKDFGSVSAGSTSASATFTLTNTGDAPSTAIATSITGAFEIVTDGCAGAPLGAHASCTIDARFAPQSTGAAAGQLTAIASTGGSTSAMLLGTGLTGPNLFMSPTGLSFPTTAVGATSSAMSITVGWTGAQTTGTLATSLTGAAPGDFQIDADTCAGTQLGPNEQCQIDVRFRPTATGPRTATVSVSALPGGTVGAALLGTGQ